MVRALASHARGHRFKSCCLHHEKQRSPRVDLCFSLCSDLQQGLRVGAVLREQNALPHKETKPLKKTAKATIDNCRAGRAAKGASPVVSTTNSTLFGVLFFVVETTEILGSLYYHRFTQGARNGKVKNFPTVSERRRPADLCGRYLLSF